MKIEINIFERRCEKRHRGRIVGRFAGAYYVNQNGEYVVMSQSVPPSVALTVPLIFTQDGATVRGPVGSVSSSDPSVSPSLSADGQAVNFNSPLVGPFKLTWQSADASVAPFSVDVDVIAAPPAPGPIVGSFGTIVPGTTP